MTDIVNAGEQGKGHGLLCPVCRVDLVMSERQGIEIDYCPKCRGVWLDRGELDKIIERSEGGAAPAPQTQPANPRPARVAPTSPQQDYYSDERQGGHGDYRDSHGGGHGGGHGRNRKRSFLGGLFD